MFNLVDEEVDLNKILQPEQEQSQEKQVDDTVKQEEIQSTVETTENLTPTQVMYNYLREKNYIKELEDVNDEVLDQEVDNIPLNLLNNYLSNYSEEERKILEYAKAGASMDQIREYIIGKQPIVIDQSKEDYLKSKYRAQFVTEEDLDEHIESLKADNKLDDYFNHFKAKDEEAKKAEAEKQRKLEEEQLKAAQAKTKKFQQNLHKEYEAMNWSDEVKQQVAPYVSSKKIGELASKVSTSPKAFIQLGYLFSMFDEEKGEFNFDRLGALHVSNMNEEEMKNLQKKSFSSFAKTIKNTGNNDKPKNSLLSSLIIEE